MAAAIGKLTIIIGAGIVGTALAKEGHLFDVTGLFSGALKIVTRHLQKDKDNSSSTGKPHNDALLAQVNNLRQELQLLASSRSVTIITGIRSGSGAFTVKTVIVIGVVGYGYIWWKGWKISDMMFVTRRGFTDACSTVAKQLDLVSSSISAAKRHLSSRIDRVDCNLNESVELTAATKEEVSKLHGKLSGFHDEFESVHQAVQSLETKLGRIEGNQDFTTRGVYHLCQFVQGLEKSRNTDSIQVLPSSSVRALELPETKYVTRTESLPSPTQGPSSPSVSIETPKVLRPSRTVSVSGFKEIQEVSNGIITGDMRPTPHQGSTSAAPNGGSSSNSGRMGWKLPSIFPIIRTHSAAS
ncbi:hypothetical protein J5N97_022091 [Dioscorea zingiberensis]|uniref:DUF1664 domain-containing protein n=1 Tax=Dioscorea zingiberensis TaxID=325984 RepID=A0A9D5HAA7_9LILI|nr:hypothetical protein J5N97_022091 [Dioscorea zingiberensis]